MKRTLIITSAALAVLGVSAFAADPISISPSTPPADVAAPAPSPALPQPTAPPVAADAQPPQIPLRMLRVVQDSHERHTPWRQSADAAVARINEASLKASVQQQLTAIAPQVAKLLMDQPTQTGLVTVAVYKERGSDHQVLGAVAFEGLGDALNPSFYPRLLANVPQVPGANPDLAQKLELDPTATSYLLFFVDHGDLKADDVPHPLMKQSLDLAMKQDRPASDSAPTLGTQTQNASDQQANVEQQRQSQTDAQIQQAQANQYAQSSQSVNPPSGEFTAPYWQTSSGSPYAGLDGWVPWFAYVPGTGQQAVVVRPDYHNTRYSHASRADATATDRRVSSNGVRSGAGVNDERNTPGTVRGAERSIQPARASAGGAIDNRVDARVGAAPSGGVRTTAPEPTAARVEPSAARGEPAARSEAGAAHAEPTPARSEAGAAHAEPAPARSEAPAGHSSPAPAAHSAPAPAPAPAGRN